MPGVAAAAPAPVAADVATPVSGRGPNLGAGDVDGGGFTPARRVGFGGFTGSGLAGLGVATVTVGSAVCAMACEPASVNVSDAMPAKETLATETPVKETPLKETPLKETPLKDR